MGLAVCVLASGSSGNCVVVTSDHEAIIVDSGISKKRVLGGLAEIGVAADAVRGIVLTHEHSDHSGGVGVLSRGLGVPVYSTAATFRACPASVGVLAGQVEISEREPFDIGRFRLEPFPTFHDAANPFALVIREGGGATRGSAGLGVVTDLGFVSTLAFARLEGVTAAVFESNHDRTMLMNGPYPWDLKQRIAGRQGHLDNATSAEAVLKLWESGLRTVLLAHLSEINNTPQTALDAFRTRLPPEVLASTELIVTHPDRRSEVVHVRS
ncbi:MAG: MBL fold metallo-hydrolase [Candidatus Riflebacteria bacterium]|nr:MBL fold metallo-hydrolase [Candidatus Riflebacteria bacterium]